MTDEQRRTAERHSEKRWGWLLLMSVAGNILTLVLSLVIIMQINASTQRKFCDVVISQDEAYRQTPPVTDTGRNSARNWARLRQSLGCP